jgi:Suppressor of fused protein (SUFU)
MNKNESVFSAINGHYRSMWPNQRFEDFVWSIGPISANVPNMLVTRVQPESSSDAWYYASRGAWQIQTDGPRLEFFLSCPDSNPIHVETLAMVANLHADKRYRIKLGQIIKVGRPWVEKSSCDHLLVSLPYLLGPRFEYLRVLDLEIRFMWLVPITQAEAEFARAHGVPALEEAFERAAFDTMDPKRRSVV